MVRFPIVLGALLTLAGAASAQDKITVGKITSGSGFHIPSYVAMDQGYFKAEGLDASFVILPGRPLVTAGLTGSIDFIPIPSGGAQAALSGAPIKYVVGESLKSHWLIISKPTIAKPEDLKGKTLAYGRPGSADYDEGAAVMLRAFNMQVGRDYKVISFQGESERVPALLNGDVDAILVSVPNAPKALNGGMKVLVRVSDYIQRAGGSFWTRKDLVEQRPETVKKFIRAIARGVMHYRDNKKGSFASLKEHLGVDNETDAGIVWEETHNTFGAELPPDKFRDIFESRRQDMIAAKQWPADKPLPDPEQYLARNLLDPTLKAMNYVPTKLDAAAH
jgi:NitT/TauT family transport system substrate-binding protein